MAKCRVCGGEIGFKETANGKLMPVNADDSPHPATCPEAPRNKRPPLPDDVCLACGSQDIERLPGVGPHYGAIRCRECKARRWLRKPQESTT